MRCIGTPNNRVGKMDRALPDRDQHRLRVDAAQMIEDVRSGIARADDENVLAGIAVRVAEIGGVDQPSRVVAAPRPVRDEGRGLAAGGDDHMPGRDRPAAGLEPPAVIGLFKRRHRDAEFDRNVQLAGVILQIADQRVPAGKGSGILRHLHARQLRQVAMGVEVQLRMPAAPRTGDLVRFFEKAAPECRPGSGNMRWQDRRRPAPTIATSVMACMFVSLDWMAGDISEAGPDH
jgi:hypothetical protein